MRYRRFDCSTRAVADAKRPAGVSKQTASHLIATSSEVVNRMTTEAVTQHLQRSGTFVSKQTAKRVRHELDNTRALVSSNSPANDWGSVTPIVGRVFVHRYPLVHLAERVRV